ncbi:hypothetical protein LPTSP4_35530 [Leptospira ryugenii]|uniref:Uncharacterized protein n=1 Tax=Leptospira ryugenii TaxID=1917863 RepID=A0A2P2E546_9LEPT|nr:hypothetical protein LPTSP4_35530 [Leptospira ryugenii]
MGSKIEPKVDIRFHLRAIQPSNASVKRIKKSRGKAKDQLRASKKYKVSGMNKILSRVNRFGGEKIVCKITEYVVI